MTRTCAVRACPATHRTIGVKFFIFPSYLESMPSLSTSRFEKWLKALGFLSTYNPKNKFVCSKHFVSGKPAKLTDSDDIDWIPTINIPQKKPDLISDIINSSLSGQIDVMAEDESRRSEWEKIRINFGSFQTNDDNWLHENDQSEISWCYSTYKNQNTMQSFTNYNIEIENESNAPNPTYMAHHLPNHDNNDQENHYRQQQKENEEEIIRLRQRIVKLENEVSCSKRGLKWINNDERCKRYTGLNNYTTLKRIYEYVEPMLFEPICKMTKDQTFIMTLRKMRSNLSFSELADEYSVCPNTISKFFHRTVYILHENLVYSLDMPPKENTIRHTPRAFQQHYGKRRIFIIDCFEVSTQCPTDAKAANSHRSSYKQDHTTKFMIAVTADGRIAFISNGYVGRCSDRFIAKASGFLNLIEENDVILADKGFDIADLVASKGAILNIPTFLRKGTQLSPTNIEKDKQLTSLRVHVERLIGMVKLNYKYVNGVIQVDALRRKENNMNSVDIIVRLACILLNFNRSVIPNN